jgi:hypothetical protein
MTHSQPDLDHRDRDKNGEISRKHGDTKKSTLRQTWDPALLRSSTVPRCKRSQEYNVH